MTKVNLSPESASDSFNESMALKLLNLAGINLANEEFLAKKL